MQLTLKLYNFKFIFFQKRAHLIKLGFFLALNLNIVFYLSVFKAYYGFIEIIFKLAKTITNNTAYKKGNP